MARQRIAHCAMMFGATISSALFGARMGSGSLLAITGLDPVIHLRKNFTKIDGYAGQARV
jgi:hypothetical protein